jgi:hypothetical protein
VGTHLCDKCWETETKIANNPEIAKTIVLRRLSVRDLIFELKKHVHTSLTKGATRSDWNNELLLALQRIANNAEARLWNTEEDATMEACREILREARAALAVIKNAKKWGEGGLVFPQSRAGIILSPNNRSS